MNDPATLARCIAVTNARHGTIMHLSNDAYIGRSLEAYGEFSEAEIDLWAQYVKPGHLVFDIGANIGAHTVALANLVGPRGVVLAFEPVRFLYHMLCGNLALNGLTNVRAYQCGVGANSREMNVPAIDFTQPDTYGGVALSNKAAGEPVSIISIDESVRVPACHFMKIDVEGMELDVLRGAHRLITRMKPVLYVEHNDTQTGRWVLEFIAAHGYRAYLHEPPLFNPENYFRKQEDVFAGQFEGQIHNLLCLPADYPAPLGLARMGPPERVADAGAAGCDDSSAPGISR